MALDVESIIMDALLDLCAEQPLARVTVKQILQRSGVSRQTFYNHYPDAELLPIHWGCVDAPAYTPFNGDPERLAAAIKNPERIHALALGEGLQVQRRR